MAALTEDALTRGAKLMAGGPRSGGGFFWNPTVLSDVAADARVMQEEPFGPLAPFSRFDDLDTALQQSNSLDYGLAGYAYTSSTRSARRIQEGLRVGMVALNTCSATAPEMPFAGTRPPTM